MTDVVGHFLLFAALAVMFLLLPLLLGRLLRPSLPTAEKDAIYECGEPTIGSSFVQFDLRFYVVALLFIIFDVEVAFFFPWATAYGEFAQLMDTRISASARADLSAKLLNAPQVAPENVIQPQTATQLSMVGLADILVFFGVLLVGFAYVWKRGDLDWVRAMAERAKQAAAIPKTPPLIEREPVPKSQTVA